jgi:hypothetical protein
VTQGSKSLFEFSRYLIFSLAGKTNHPERDTELGSLKDEYKKSTKAKLYNEVSALEGVITCYRKALIAWDNMHRIRDLTEQDRLTISTELRSNISNCPPI